MSYRILSWLLIIFACFYGIGAYPLLDDNEGLYAVIARDMLSSGHFIIPHLNGLPYIEKPPLLYWLLAGSMSIFGVNEWGARLVPALACFITAWLMQRFIFRITRSDTASLTASLLLVTSLPMLAIGRSILCDMLMTCLLTAALINFFKWYVQPRPRHLLWFYALVALAVLTKGLLALVLVGGIILFFLFWQGSPLKRYFRVLSPRGILLFLCIAAPWHIAAAFEEQDFLWFYFINEHLMRFLDLREPHDYYGGPFWYYLPRIAAYLAPWTFFLVLLLRRPRHVSSEYPALTRFLWSWFMLCLLFFSASAAKSNYYMITGMPPLMMLLALQIKYRADSKINVLHCLTSGSFLVMAIVFWQIKSFCSADSGHLYSTCAIASYPLFVGSLLFAVAATILSWRMPRRWLPLLLGSTVVLLLPLAISGIHLAPKLSQKSVVEYLKTLPYEDVALYQEFEELSTIAFYTNKPVYVVNSFSNDLLYGKQYSDDKSHFLSLHDWAEHTPRMPIVLFTQQLDRLMMNLLKLHVDLKDVCILRRFERVYVVNMCDPALPAAQTPPPAKTEDTSEEKVEEKAEETPAEEKKDEKTEDKAEEKPEDKAPDAPAP